jgi:hypothetical protein
MIDATTTRASETYLTKVDGGFGYGYQPDVIDQGYWRGPGRIVAGLHLSSAQSALVRDSIPRDFPEANLRLRLALGAEIPDDVELYDFPRIVVDRVPELREFRFLVTDEQIVIIDPHDRSIALMVDRA